MPHHRSRRRALLTSLGPRLVPLRVRAFPDESTSRTANRTATATVAVGCDSSGDSGIRHHGPSVLCVLPAPSRDRIARASWSTPALLALAAVVVRLGALLSSKHLTFDDGNYGVSVVDMRHGLAPYADLFSSQGPLHLPLLFAGDLLALHTIDGPRVTPVLAGVAVTIAVWACARRLGARTAVAVSAALLVGTTGSMIWATAPITVDGPEGALIACAAWSALVYRDDPRLWRALLTGALAGAAIATKPLVFPALVPIAWWLGAPRRVRPAVAAGASAIFVWFAAALPWQLDRVWRQSVTYHTGPAPTYSARFQFGKLVSMLVLRDAILVAAVVLGLVALARRRGGPPLR